MDPDCNVSQVRHQSRFERLKHASKEPRPNRSLFNQSYNINMEERKKIAKWLNDKILEEEWVYQSSAVQEIIEEFGDKFSYINENGNPAIDADVLKEFRKIKDKNIEWDRQDFCWRLKDDNTL